MSPIVGSVEISRRPEDVFAYVLDPLRSPEWDTSIISAHRRDPSPLAVGAKTTVMHRMGPWKVPTIEELVELTPPRQFTNRGTSGPLAGVAKCTVEPVKGGQRSRLTITLELQTSGLGKLLLPFARARARRAIPSQLNKLKEILDQDETRADPRPIACLICGQTRSPSAAPELSRAARGPRCIATPSRSER